MAESDSILIVDDDPGLREMLSAALDAEGYTSIAVAGGEEALSIIREIRPPIALVDLRMEAMSGIDLIKEIKEISAETACIMLTGFSSRETAMQAINLGAYGYLEKPCEVSELLLTVRRAIEKHRAEEALRRSEERFRSVAQLAADGIVIVDGEGKIVFSNQAAQSIFGYPEEEITGKAVTLLIPEQDLRGGRPGIKLAGSSSQGQGAQKIIEVKGRRKDGTGFPLELSVAAWMSGKERYFGIILRDVSEARESQSQAQRQDRLAAVGQLAAGIAHDFNNTLGAIVLYAQMLQNEEGISPTGRENLRVILQQAERAAKLIIQILDFSRRSLIEPRPIDFLAFLRELRELLTRTLPENIQLKLEYPDGDYFVNADPSRLQQVILNLALNARDAMPEGGELRFSLSRVSVPIDKPIHAHDIPRGDWVRLEVIDTGTGISPEDLNHIFEPFFTTKEQGKGTGLGLAQVYGIVKQHDGYIDVESTVGTGTKFTIFLPAVEEPEKQEEQIRDERPSGESKETILIVEDDLAIRRAIADILESLGYLILVASSGQEALSIFEQNLEDIDMVLSDMVLPDMSGDSLRKIISKRRPEVLAIMMTGYPLGKDTRELRTKEGVTWLQKPVRLETLTQTISRAFNGKNHRETRSSSQAQEHVSKNGDGRWPSNA